MRSSISSFRPELKVLAMLAAVLVAGEVGMRVVGPRFSIGLRRITGIPANAERMAKAKEVRVLVLGNSLTNQGFKPDIFRDTLASQGSLQTHVLVRYFPGSVASEWFHLFKHFYVDTGRLPDVLLLPCDMTAVRDATPITIERLAHFCDVEDIPQMFRDELKTFSDRALFLHCYLLDSFGGREKVRHAVLSKLVPYYREGEEAIHAAAAAPAPSSKPRPAVTHTHENIKRLLQLARQHNVEVICAIISTLEPYEVDEGFARVVAATGSHLVDVRKDVSLNETHFTDGLHMTPSAAAEFTRALARRLVRERTGVFQRRQDNNAKPE